MHARISPNQFLDIDSCCSTRQVLSQTMHVALQEVEPGQEHLVLNALADARTLLASAILAFAGRGSSTQTPYADTGAKTRRETLQKPSEGGRNKHSATTWVLPELRIIR